MDSIHVYVDGGCKGNGMSDAKSYGSYAVVYQGIAKKAEYMFDLPDAHTNNEAEYGALNKALAYLDGLFERGRKYDVVIHTDSQLMVGQVALGFKVKAQNLAALVGKAKTWFAAHPNVKIEKIDRNEIVKWLGH